MVQLVQSQGMLFTTKHVVYQVKVCSRDLLVFWHFPTASVHLYVNSQHTSRARSRDTRRVTQSATLDTFQVRSKCM